MQDRDDAPTTDEEMRFADSADAFPQPKPKKRPQTIALFLAGFGALGAIAMFAIPIAVLFLPSLLMRTESVEISVAVSQMMSFESQLEMYRLDVGEYPSTAQGLAALRVCPNNLEEPEQWDGPYTHEDFPTDPWNNSFHYTRLSAEQFQVVSAGPDGQLDTEDDLVHESL